MQRTDAERFVEVLAQRHQGTVVLTGTASLLMLDTPVPSVEDAHTFCGTPEYLGPDSPLAKTFESVRAELGLPKPTTLPYRRMPALKGAEARRVTVRTGALEVQVEDPYTTALCMLLRNSKADFTRVVHLCERGVLERRRLLSLGAYASEKLDGALDGALRRLAIP